MKLTTILRNPIERRKNSVELCSPAGNVMKEVLAQEVNDDISRGYDSKELGNHGKHCSWTLECQTICNWVSWGPSC